MLKNAFFKAKSALPSDIVKMQNAKLQHRSHSSNNFQVATSNSANQSKDQEVRRHSTEVASQFSPSCPGFDSWHSRRFLSFDVAKINPLLSRWTVLKVNNVDQTHLVVLVLKSFDKGQLKILFVFQGASATSAGKFYPTSFSTV